MQDLSWADRNAAEQLDRRLFEDLDTYEVVELSDRTEVDPDEIVFRFSDPRFGGTFGDAVEIWRQTSMTGLTPVADTASLQARRATRSVSPGRIIRNVFWPQ